MTTTRTKRSLESDLYDGIGRSSKRRRKDPIVSMNSTTAQQNNSFFFVEIYPKIKKAKIAVNIKEDVQRFTSMDSDLRNQESFTSNDNRSNSSIPSRMFPPDCEELPVFTLNHVRVICDHIIKEKEKQIKEEYDQVLKLKLAEQYNTFVKFTQDQIDQIIQQMEAKGAPSYLS